MYYDATDFLFYTFSGSGTSGTWTANAGSLLASGTTTSGSGLTAGVGSALPATPAGYVAATIGGAQVYLPYYTPLVTNISAVGSYVTGSGTTLAFTAAHVGDMLMFYCYEGVSTVTTSGTGTTTAWSVISGTGTQLWWAVVTGTGSMTITLGFSVPYSSCQEFSPGSALATDYTWSVDGSQHGNATGTSSVNPNTISLPSLTATGSNELYYGIFESSWNVSAGSTAGFTYNLQASTNYFGQCYNPSANGTLAPTAQQNTNGSSQTWLAPAVLMIATA
jgi:hypothetical protein